MKKVIIIPAIILGLVSAASVFAADILLPQSDTGNQGITIGVTEVHKNVYIAASNVTINANTTGDVVAAGGTVTVNGDVEQDAIVAGGTITTFGAIGGNARIAGGNVSISSAIKGDLVIAGGNLNITNKASVAGDLLAAGGSVLIEAPVSGVVRVAGGNVTINSKVSGNIYARAGSELVFGPNADVAGTVYYKAPQTATLQNGAKVSHLNFTELARNSKNPLLAIITLGFLIQLCALILVGLLIAQFKKSFLFAVFTELSTKPWQNLGWGLVTAIVLPILSILLFFTFVGYYLGLILGVFFVLMVLIAHVLAAFMLGYFILRLLTKPGEPAHDWQAIIIGVVVYSLLRFIPIFGWIVIIILFLMTFGALIKMLRYALFPAK